MRWLFEFAPWRALSRELCALMGTAPRAGELCRETRFWRHNSLLRELRCAPTLDRVVAIELVAKRTCATIMSRSFRRMDVGCRMLDVAGDCSVRRSRSRRRRAARLRSAGGRDGEWDLSCQRAHVYACIVSYLDADLLRYFWAIFGVRFVQELALDEWLVRGDASRNAQRRLRGAAPMDHACRRRGARWQATTAATMIAADEGSGTGAQTTIAAVPSVNRGTKTSLPSSLRYGAVGRGL